MRNWIVERLPGPLALSCAITVFLATAFDVESGSAPMTAAVVQASP